MNFTKSCIALLLALAAISVAWSGCSALTPLVAVKYFGNPANPFQNARTFVVVPFVNLTGEQVDCLEVADVFAGEMAQFPGFQVRRPAVVLADARQNGITIPLLTVAAAVRLAQAAGVDAIVVGAVTEYNPYYPPRVAVALQVIFAGQTAEPVMDVSPWVASGKPLVIQRDDAPRVLAMFEEVFDSNKQFTRLEIRGYTKTHVGSDSVFEEEETFLRIMNKYMQFVSNRLIRKVIEVEKARQERLKKQG